MNQYFSSFKNPLSCLSARQFALTKLDNIIIEQLMSPSFSEVIFIEVIFLLMCRYIDLTENLVKQTFAMTFQTNKFL